MNLVSDPENLDASVEEVFRLMLGVSCSRDERAEAHATENAESVTAVVGFGGLLSGACVLRCSGVGAKEIAARLTGMEFSHVDETVKDAVGEICNMLAGAWKSKVPNLAAHCGLSVPAVITGCDYNFHVHALEFRLNRTYWFNDQTIDLTITCDGIQ
jgi:chemotaxis protein CheX